MNNRDTVFSGKIKDTLQFIYQQSVEYTNLMNEIQGVSLYTGLSGIYLFQIYYEMYDNSSNLGKSIDKKIADLLSIYGNNSDNDSSQENTSVIAVFTAKIVRSR